MLSINHISITTNNLTSRLLALLLISCFFLSPYTGKEWQVSAFWFADSSLFQPPIDQQQMQTPIIIADGSNRAIPTIKITGEQVGQQELQNLEQQTKVTEQKLAQTGDSNQSSRPQQQHECQCNVDWLQNQTSLWLSKWLVSVGPSIQQIRLPASNSTGASNIHGGRFGADAKQQQPVSGNNNNGAAANPGLARATTSSPRDGGAHNGAANGYSSSQRAARSRHQPRGSRSSSAKQLAQQGERGPQGAKGDQGPRGEKGEQGPSGLIRVKDRESLFDLSLRGASGMKLDESGTGSGNGNKDNANGIGIKSWAGSLVFIEAEQMLVVGTQTGWQPVQLLAPLHDFRRTIAKFSLSSAEERLKLLGSSKTSTSFLDRENLISPLLLRRQSKHQQGDAMLAVQPNSGNQLDKFAANRNKKIDDDYDDDDDDDDVDGDEDDDDNDDDEFEDDDSNDREDNNNSLRENDERRESRQVNGSRPSAARGSQVVGRSAMATAVAGATITTTSTPKSAQPDGRMKLRMVALNQPFSGNVHGIRGADFECKRDASRSKVKGSFRAFLASGFQNLNDVIRHNVQQHQQAIVNLRGETLANSWHDLFRQPARLANPLSRIYSFDGRHVATDPNWPNKLVWHGARNRLGQRDLAHNCDGWHSDSLSKFAYATPLHLPRNHQPLGQAASKRTKQQGRRHLTMEGRNSTTLLQANNAQRQLNGYQTSAGLPAFLEVIEKYPCRMPLIVLCIETVGQQQQLQTAKESLVDASNESNAISYNNM